MNCERVQSHLSEFFDEMLDTVMAVQVSQHLDKCTKCRKEFDRLSMLHTRLETLKRLEVPDYLYHLLQLRLDNSRKETWRASLRSALEYRWSKIRTTEGIWYVTRALGTVMTAVLFFIISYSMNPILLSSQAPFPDRGSLFQAYRERLGISVLKNLGLMPIEAQKRPISSSEPMINGLYLLNFGQSVPRDGEDDTFSVVTVVDRSGSAKIQNVLGYPADKSLLNEFTTMVTSARYRPGSHNGRAVDSHLVLTFSKISVYD